MLLPESLSSETFLADYWQKQPLYLPAAIKNPLPTLDADELAWLATLEDVESRLVFTDITGGQTRYRVSHGPFTESELNALPHENWTLLVQDVEKHLPDFRDYFSLVPFIPKWRIDDLMVSVAAPGGSVGPHKDNYDVFLCQGDGQREWRLSDGGSVSQDKNSTALSLLEPFAPSTCHLCTPGDVLYLPPGVPHWGIAQGLCTTYSIGMRAPTDTELAAGSGRIRSPNANPSPIDQANYTSVFYSDRDLQLCETKDGSISTRAVRRIREQSLLDASLNEREIAAILGSVTTDPKAWLVPEPPSGNDLTNVIHGHYDLPVHGMARLAWYSGCDFKLVFVNGSTRDLPAAGTELMHHACVNRLVQRAIFQALASCPGGSELIAWLLEQGLFDLEGVRK